MKIAVNTELTFDVDEIAAKLSPDEMLTLFALAANRLAEDGPQEKRRCLAQSFGACMSENAKKMLAEIFAAEYVDMQSRSR